VHLVSPLTVWEH